jgi:predicted nucleic acid-binding protein
MALARNGEVVRRIAVDTGVWLDGMMRGGPAEELVKLAVTGKVRLITSEAMIGHLTTTLEQKLSFSPKATAELVRMVRDCSDVVPDLAPAAGPSPAASVRDSVLEVAKRGKVDAIATIHRPELAKMGNFEGIPIIEVG